MERRLAFCEWKIGGVGCGVICMVGVIAMVYVVRCVRLSQLRQYTANTMVCQ